MKPGCGSSQIKKKRSIKLPVLDGAPEQSGEIRKSRNSRWRAVALITLNLLMIAHIIQWRLMGQTISPIEPSETMYTIQQGAVNAGFIFFALAILATLIFGRFVCGWGCHIVALQDLCAWLLKKIGLTPKPFRSRLLVFVPIIGGLYMFLWPTVSRAILDPESQMVPNFSNHLVTSNFWQTFPTVAVAIPFLFVCGFMTVYFLGSKGFCTYACPYGGFFGVADKLAAGKIRVTDACNQCGHCTATCTSNVIVHAEVKQYGMVVDPGCMKCMDCVSVCPNDALYFGFGKPSLAVSKTLKKNYSLSWTEEIVGALVFLGSFLAVRGVYVLVPLLMALGWAAITTFLFLKTWRLLRTAEMSFYKFNLKSAGALNLSGWVFLSFSLLWIGGTVHSGFVRYHEYRGDRAFQRLQIQDELALAQANPTEWLNSNDLENSAAGQRHYEAANRFGLFSNGEGLAKFAWFVYLSGTPDRAVQLLSEAATHQKGQSKAVSLYYRGAILNRLGRYEEARTSLDQALAESDLILALEEKGESLWLSGQKKEAVASWVEALKRNKNLVLAHNQLAGAAAAFAQPAEATAYQRIADQLTPNDPYYHWMIGLRLQNLGMNELAEKHFQRAIQLNPSFNLRRKWRNVP
jgi:polyferredoxin/tetratricopeptide (TPR) repeat protein